MLKEANDKCDEDNALTCLNPYFNGTCSKSVFDNAGDLTWCHVLILILMEHAQRESSIKVQFTTLLSSLNPYFNGTCSKRRPKIHTLQNTKMS